MDVEPHSYADELGPEKILHLYDPRTELRAIVVVDNTACGPAIGGCRMAPDVSLDECFRLARAMTLKNAAALLPHGGGKSVIFADPRMSSPDKERLMRAFARAIGEIEDYIVGPDMGTNEIAMAWCRDEIGRAVGLPPEIGGIPLDEIGATGYGLSICAEAAQSVCNITLDGARVVIEGFGSVGRHSARFLAEHGTRLVGAADSHGIVVNPDQLNVEALIEHKLAGNSVQSFSGGTPAALDFLLDIDCDIFVPAARPDVLRLDNADSLKARLVLPGANIAVTREAERSLHARGVVVVPDFIANAGGVICASVEFHGGTRSNAFESIKERIGSNTRLVLEGANSSGDEPRKVAEAVALQRVKTAMQLRR